MVSDTVSQVVPNVQSDIFPNKAELLPISHRTIGKVQQLSVDARVLHSTLKVKRDFSTWIKGRIDKYGFIEGEDFEKSSIISCSPDLVNGDFSRLQQSIEYSLSLDMGKELAMVETNEMGRLVRRYFIECERRAFAPTRPTATLLPYQVIRTLPKPMKDRLNDLVNTKLAHVPTAFGWKTRMRIWKQFNKAFHITRYELLPETRMTEAITFLTGLDVGHGGVITCKAGLVTLPMSTAQTTAASLEAAIEQGKALLASLSAFNA